MGHKRTIRPNAKRLSSLFSGIGKMEWSTFARKVKSCQRGFMGEPEEMKPGRGEFHEYPSACICQKPSKYSFLDKKRGRPNTGKFSNATGIGNTNNEPTEERLLRRGKGSTKNATSFVEETDDRDDFLSD